MKVKAKTFQNEPKFDKNSHLHGQNKQSDQDAPILHRKHRHRNQTPNLLKSIQTTHSDNCLNQDDQQNMLSYVILQNLNYNTNEETLYQFFSQWDVLRIEIFRSPNGKSKGSGYAIFNNNRDAIKAITTLKDKPILDGKEIKIQLINVRQYLEEIINKKDTKQNLIRSDTVTIFETKKELVKPSIIETNDLLHDQFNSINQIKDDIHSLNTNFQAFNTFIQAVNTNVQALNTNIQAVNTKFDTKFEQINKFVGTNDSFVRRDQIYNTPLYLPPLPPIPPPPVLPGQSLPSP